MKVKALLNVKKRNWKVAVCNIRAENMEAAAKLVDAFKKCPRVIFLQTLTGSYNLIIIETEVRSQPGIKTLDISIGDSPVLPEFLDIRNPREKKDVPPCGINNCTTCYLYQKDCEGCPATKYFRKSSPLL